MIYINICVWTVSFLQCFFIIHGANINLISLRISIDIEIQCLRNNIKEFYGVLYLPVGKVLSLQETNKIIIQTTTDGPRRFHRNENEIAITRILTELNPEEEKVAQIKGIFSNS